MYLVLLYIAYHSLSLFVVRSPRCSRFPASPYRFLSRTLMGYTSISSWSIWFPVNLLRKHVTNESLWRFTNQAQHQCRYCSEWMSQRVRRGLPLSRTTRDTASWRTRVIKAARKLSEMCQKKRHFVPEAS